MLVAERGGKVAQSLQPGKTVFISGGDVYKGQRRRVEVGYGAGLADSLVKGPGDEEAPVGDGLHG